MTRTIKGTFVPCVLYIQKAFFFFLFSHHLAFVLLRIHPEIPPHGHSWNAQCHHRDGRDAAILHVLAPGYVDGVSDGTSDKELLLFDIASDVDLLELVFHVVR